MTSSRASTSSISSTTAGNLLPVDPTPDHDRVRPDALRHRLGVQQRRADGRPGDARASTGSSTIPTDAAPVAAYYLQAINKDAPHPAAARLWQEFLYTPEAQNEWLKGFARPVLLDKMVKDGTVDQAALGKLGKASGTAVVMTQEQAKKAGDYVGANWSIELP